MAANVFHALENWLEPVFGDLPPLSKNLKDILVIFWPILAVILGLLQLFAAWSLWQLGHTTNEIIEYANQLSRAYGTGEAAESLGFFYWVDLTLLIADAVVLLFAFAGLRAHRKEGWELLFLSVVIYMLYGVVALFDVSHGGIVKCIGVLITCALGLYLLYQVRNYYGRRMTHAEKHLPAPKK